MNELWYLIMWLMHLQLNFLVSQSSDYDAVMMMNGDI